nr:MAG TPA: hypothetical protein [Caudoviricetes sp.]
MPKKCGTWLKLTFGAIQNKQLVIWLLIYLNMMNYLIYH